MRTNIEIDDDLMSAAMSAVGASTKRGTVELGLRMLIAVKKQEQLRALKGTLAWPGDLDEMRRDT